MKKIIPQVTEETDFYKILEGATMLVRLAEFMEDAARMPFKTVKLKRRDVKAIANCMRLGAQMIDNLTVSVENSEPVKRPL